MKKRTKYYEKTVSQEIIGIKWGRKGEKVKHMKRRKDEKRKQTWVTVK